MSALDIYDNITSIQTQAIEQADKSMKRSHLRTPKDFEPNTTTRLRIVPPSRAMMELAAQQGVVPEVFFEYHRHMYEIGGHGTGNWAVFACPSKNLAKYGGKQQCIDCAKGRQLRQNNARESGPWKLGMGLGADHLRVILVIDRDKPELGVHALGISAPVGKPKGRSMYEKLTAALNDEHTGGNFLHPVEGRDILCKKSVTSSARDGTDYTWALAPKPSPLHDDPAEMVALIESQPSIADMITEEVKSGILRHAEVHGLTSDAQSRQVGGGPAGQLPQAPSAPSADADLYGDVGGSEDLIPF